MSPCGFVSLETKYSMSCCFVSFENVLSLGNASQESSCCYCENTQSMYELFHIVGLACCCQLHQLRGYLNVAKPMKNWKLQLVIHEVIAMISYEYSSYFPRSYCHYFLLALLLLSFPCFGCGHCIQHYYYYFQQLPVCYSDYLHSTQQNLVVSIILPLYYYYADSDSREHCHPADELLSLRAANSQSIQINYLLFFFISLFVCLISLSLEIVSITES